MKKLLLVFLMLFSAQMAFADDSANLRIRITGATSDNRYFLCEPNIGCLSIYNAVRKNRTYPIYETINMDNLYVTDFFDMGVSPQGLPRSCNVTVKMNQTITIYGNLIAGRNGNARISNLRCTVS